LTWHDGSRWSPTGLAKHINEQATGRRPRVVGGPRWWATPEGVTLRALADSLGDAQPGGFDWSILHRVLERLPAGRWTTYGDLAAVVGTHAQPVGQHITNCTSCKNAWRVLDSQGRVAAGFSWSDPGRTDDPADLLRAEGLHLRDGRADQQQRLRQDELLALARPSSREAGEQQHDARGEAT
jgi:alkylated DNA nucleotide flippase Atl1